MKDSMKSGPGPYSDSKGWPVPDCWLHAEGSATGADEWAGYWERLNDKQPIFRIEANDYVSRLQSAIDLKDAKRVLDFGCGFGNISVCLAPCVARLAVWDSATNMRRYAYQRLGKFDNVEFVDLTNPQDTHVVGKFDLILVNSVIQYMSRTQLQSWLLNWKGMLTPNGSLVISDIILPNYSFVRDLSAFINICRRHKVLIKSVLGGLKEIGNYGSVKASQPLLKLGRSEIVGIGAEAGFDTSILANNLTYHAGRISVIFQLPAKL